MPHSLLDVAKRTDAFFMEISPIHETMRRLNAVLDGMKIPFPIAGALAANAHGHKRTTAVVDVLLRKADLGRFKQKWIGRGWVEKFEGFKGFRDDENNVAVHVLIAGDYPGDGLPKPVAFPNPEAVVEVGPDGIPSIRLSALIELKLASGMTAVHRMQDLADVIQLIRANQLSKEYRQQLDAYVQDKYQELWSAAQVDEDY